MILACTAMTLVALGCGAYAAAVLAGRERLARLGGAATIRILITVSLLLIAAVLIGRTARHPFRHADYLATRIFRRIPGRPDDGDPLTREETATFISICRGWKLATPERTRHT
jgi:hypothetical protein